jgi:hypothetical protein
LGFGRIVRRRATTRQRSRLHRLAATLLDPCLISQARDGQSPEGLLLFCSSQPHRPYSAATIENQQLLFGRARDGNDLGLSDRSRTHHWLRGMEDAFQLIETWLP